MNKLTQQKSLSRQLNIRLRFLGLTAIGLVIILVITVLLIFFMQINSQLKIAKLSAFSEIKEYFITIQSEISSAAQYIGMNDSPKNSLMHLTTMNPSVYYSEYYDLNATLIAHYGISNRDSNINIIKELVSQMRIYDTLMQSHKGEDGNYHIEIAAPVVNEIGITTGILVARSRIDDILKLIIQIKPNKTGMAFIIDRNGEVIASPKLNKIQNRFIVYQRDSNLKEENRIQLARGIDGAFVVAIAEPIDKLGWWLILQIPLMTVFGPIFIILILTALFVILVILAFRSHTHFVNNSVNSPIKEIQQQTTLFLRNRKISPFTITEYIEYDELSQCILRMEKEINDFISNLEAKVEERTNKLTQALSDLKTSQKKLVQKEREVATGKLVQGLAHSFNTPFGAMLTAHGILCSYQNKLPKEDRKKYNELLNIFEQSLEKSTDLMNTISTASYNTGSAVIQDITLDDFIDYIIKDNNSSEDNIHFVNRMEDLTFRTDHRILRIIISEILANTSLFSTEKQLYIQINVSGKELQCILWNSGPEIPPKFADSIFMPFFSSQTFLRKGLGLYIAKSLAEGPLNGTFELTVNTSDKVEFTITIPQS